MSVTHPTKIHNDSRSHDMLLGGVLAYMTVMLVVGCAVPSQLPEWLRMAGLVLAAASSVVSYRIALPRQRAK